MNPVLKYAIFCTAWIPVLVATDYEGDHTAHRAIVVLAVIFWSFVTDMTRAVDEAMKKRADNE